MSVGLLAAVCLVLSFIAVIALLYGDDRTSLIMAFSGWGLAAGLGTGLIIATQPRPQQQLPRTIQVPRELFCGWEGLRGETEVDPLREFTLLAKASELWRTDGTDSERAEVQTAVLGILAQRLDHIQEDAGSFDAAAFAGELAERRTALAAKLAELEEA
ncbi:hypothetical protein JNJ66_05105 [Candidatus Saccharibacteria bacterium]|nr:hypothetical protein [Candidatus Saccharibacteria bacterium]